ncbi:ribonuclease HII [Vagococcus xieshaowenii]|uniref:Ribonuclease HII n=1 Tax=Vagococcus xieshaowenii TaxID=2562451 RepID=A0AAJ5EFD4_9ENTE|nr:ribonuclease HII [Vagococcus xieshaowenii]QCA28480.1 ribonuclease HII [Vagococcus xieshaowenii]TFZ42765.1 ribonuclease HII [Vagococcus xieshaowenii]
MTLTIKEVKTLLLDRETSNQVIADLRLDERKGVQTLLAQYDRRIEKEKKAQELFEYMQTYEREARHHQYQLIAGIDEVGRGPLAGPVVAAAVILPEEVDLVGINDSKQLSHAKREILLDKIKAQALAIGIGIVSPEEIDRINIYEATKVAMIKAIQQLKPTPDYLLLDAMKLPTIALPQESIIKGDTKSISIAAASIVAKETRDQLMSKYDQQYPGYGFADNAGYGTAKHLEGLNTLGITPIHRRTFAPIKDMI